MRFHGDGPLLGVQGAGKAMEVFRIRGEAQAKKKMKRCVRLPLVGWDLQRKKAFPDPVSSPFGGDGRTTF